MATGLAQTLPGSPIVGFYNEDKKDFEGHEKTLVIEDGKIRFKELTRPYGFVDLNPKVWFEWFKDDGIYNREYLVTEGYIWTGQYPESQRIIDKGNNQSMELDEKLTKATRANLDNSKLQFFILNEAVMSKLCILGEDIEPCFEGSTITADDGTPTVQFSFDESFKQQLFDMMNELKEFMLKGGNEMSEINKDNVVEEVTGAPVVEEPVVETPAEPTATELPLENTVVENQNSEDNSGESAQTNFEKNTEDKKKKICPECGKPVDECTCEDEESKSAEGNGKPEEDDEDKKKAKKKYELSEVVEYTELLGKYETLEQNYNNLQSELTSLREFKLAAERKDKEAMIKSFTMLSDEDKADVVANIDTYSVDDIEAKLAVICVRNKVSFSLEEDEQEAATSYNLTETQQDDSLMPAWVKAIKAVKDSENY